MAIDNAERHGQRCVDYPIVPGHALQTDNTAIFFNAIALGNESLITKFIEKNPEISNTTNEHGETPLMAAVRADKPAIVRDLLWNGAKVDALANYSQQGQSSQTLRTALQVAAAEGKLHMISILRENRADVFLYAPDGVNALQLAAGNGHKSVVEHIQRAYAGAIGRPHVAPGGSTPDGLTDTAEIDPVNPQRPAKPFSAQGVQMRNERSLDCITRAIQTFMLDPTTITSAVNAVLVNKPKEVRLLRKNVKLWCQEQIEKFPVRVQEGIDRATKEALGLITKTPERTWQLVKRAPNALWTIMLYIGTVLHKLGNIAPHLLKQMTAIVQTISKALACIQTATLCSIKTVLSTIHSVFTEVSKRLLALITQLKQATCAMLESGMGSLRKVIIIFAALALGICIMFSKRTGGLLQAPGKLAKKGVRDMLGLVGPRTM